MSSIINGDFHVNGNLSAKTAQLPAGTVTNTAVNSAAAIAATKLVHRNQYLDREGEDTTTATTASRVIAHSHAGGTIISFKAGTVVACTGGATIEVDLHKNGSSILGSTFTLDNGNSAYVAEAGSVSNVDLAAGDVLEVVVTAAAGGGTIGTGFFAALVVDENPQ